MNKKIKLLLNEFEFLKIQEKDIKDILEDSQTEFTNHIYQYMEENGLERQPIKKKQSNEKKETELKTNSPNKYKKLFRKIVSNTHPDKLDDDISDSDKETYKQVYEESVDLGEEFNDELNIVKSIIKEKKDSIENMKKTYAWIYCNDIEEEEKPTYIKNYYEKYKKNI